jgi:hypothetical protein
MIGKREMYEAARLLMEHAIPEDKVQEEGQFEQQLRALDVDPEDAFLAFESMRENAVAVGRPASAIGMAFALGLIIGRQHPNDE